MGAENGAAVYASSCIMLSFPVTFAILDSVPISAASPTSTSLMEKVEEDAAMRMSVAVMISIPRPIHNPCTADMTGNGR